MKQGKKEKICEVCINSKILTLYSIKSFLFVDSVLFFSGYFLLQLLILLSELLSLRLVDRAGDEVDPHEEGCDVDANKDVNDVAHKWVQSGREDGVQKWHY